MDGPEFGRLWTSDDPSERRRARELARQDPEAAAHAAWEQRLDRVSRSLRPAAPAGLLEQTLRRHRESAPRVAPVRHAWWWPAAGLAAAAMVALSLRLLVPDGGTPAAPSAPTPVGLLSDTGLDRAEQRQQALEHQHVALVSELAEATIAPSPLEEEIRLLDQAIDELQGVVGANRKHQHLRERLLDLSDRRNLLLAELAREVGG